MQMRTHHLAAAVAVAAMATLAAGNAQAQGPGQRPFENTYRRPTVSPYLQLQQQGGRPATETGPATQNEPGAQFSDFFFF